MAQLKKIGMAAGTFSVALGIGFVMQNGDALASRFGGDEVDTPAPFTVSEDQVVVTQAGLTAGDDVTVDIADAGPAVPDAPSIVMPVAVAETAVILPEAARVPETPDAPVQMASIDPEVLPEVEDLAPVSDVVSTVEVDCVPTMMAAPGEAATIDLAVTAPCHTSAAFVIHHQGMMFTASTNDAGTTKVTVPALAEVAVVIAAFENGDGAVATTTVPEFANYDRAVLQWQGDTAVMLSAYEDGANFGDPAHIHASNPGDLSRLGTAEGGYLMSLGDASVDDALMAEVYTFPTGMVSSPLDVMLVAEAEITEGNCGQELNAQSIQVTPSGDASALDLTMVMPECDAVGDFLILQNMFEDLTLAAR